MFEVLDGGFHTSIQDMGRYGYYHLGVPPSGASDKYSFQLGNLLLGNPVDSAALEVMLLGPKIQFHKRTVIVVTGAPADVYLNNHLIPMWETVAVKEGDILAFSSTKDGVCTYLCISGGITIPKMLGSRSAYVFSEFEGLLGRKVKEGDVIEYSEPLPGVFKHVGKHIPLDKIPHFQRNVDVRVVMGLTSERVSDYGVKSFLNHEWEVLMESNRVAYRLKGAVIDYNHFEPPFGSGKSSANIVDIAYPIGSILVPNNEEIIVLLNDATGGGGYVTIGTVISPDLSILSQARPKSVIRFHAVTVNQAIQIRINKQIQIKKMVEELNIL
ncbi:biotin-dependent carboxyltransferase family protein [Bacillus sp. FJAT-47783]|uniref:5-oxoprolinase subunit C family protein n=1 Tax=Bacillus sp. FJAT-47783 TaxID=2922712 RepID=UPI001FADDD76